MREVRNHKRTLMNAIIVGGLMFMPSLSVSTQANDADIRKLQSKVTKLERDIKALNKKLADLTRVLTISGGKVTVSGDLWVDGEVVVRSSARIEEDMVVGGRASVGRSLDVSNNIDVRGRINVRDNVFVKNKPVALKGGK